MPVHFILNVRYSVHGKSGSQLFVLVSAYCCLVDWSGRRESVRENNYPHAPRVMLICVILQVLSLPAPLTRLLMKTTRIVRESRH